jgi:hypothetical protein
MRVEIHINQKQKKARLFFRSSPGENSLLRRNGKISHCAARAGRCERAKKNQYR